MCQVHGVFSLSVEALHWFLFLSRLVSVPSVLTTLLSITGRITAGHTSLF